MKKREIMFGVLWILLGLGLNALSVLETLDEYWSNLGAVLVVVGATRLFRGYRLSRSDVYREKWEVNKSVLIINLSIVSLLYHFLSVFSTLTVIFILSNAKITLIFYKRYFIFIQSAPILFYSC